MADNTTLNAGSAGDSIVTREISHAGDTSKLPGSFVMGITGSEGAYTAAAINGDATNGLDVDVTRVSGNVTVIGAGTAGTANSGVVTIQGVASMTPVQIADNGGSVTVDWNGTAPPIGAGLEATALRVTLATDSTGVVSIDDNGSTISIDDGAGSITVDGTVAISGTVTTSISGTVAVTDNSGSLTVDNGGTFAVQVDGSALTALQLIDNIVLAEDAGHSTGDPGVQMLAVRNDSDTSLAGTTLDYTPLQVDSNGYLKVNIKAGAGSGGTASTDDGAFTAASGSGTPMMGFVTADSVDSGDVGVVGMLANRQLKVTLYDSSGVEAAVGGGTQYTEGATDASITGNAILWEDAADTLTPVNSSKPLPVSLASVPSHAVTNAGTFAVQATVAASATNIAKAEDVASADADVGVPAMAVRKATPANTSGTDGDYEMLQMSAGRLWTSSTIDAALPAGTNAIGKLASNTGVTIGAVEIAASQTLATVTTVTTCSTVTTLTGGNVAHANGDSGNPHKIGAKAVGTLSTQTMATANDRTNLYADRDGVLITRTSSCLADMVRGLAAITDGSSTSVIAAQGAGIKVYVTDVIIANSSASNVTVDLRDGTAGSVLATFPVPANGGVVHRFQSPVGFTANTAVAADPSAAASTVTVTLSGFMSKL